MDSATLIGRVRAQAGLTQRELASRAGTSAAAVSLYESGQRIPRVDTLTRIIASAGATVVIDAFPDPSLDDEVNGAILVQVLGVAEQLPFEAATDVTAPVFAHLAR